jgi:hypothetical protein
MLEVTPLDTCPQAVYVAIMSVLPPPNTSASAAHQRTRPLTVARRAKATLHHLRFNSGTRVGNLELAPDLPSQQRRMIAYWLDRIPPGLQQGLPPIKIAVAQRLLAVRHGVFIDVDPGDHANRRKEYTHAVSFIPERYMVLAASLFDRRVELGRILYHELCHFKWPRLGNGKRNQFKALLLQELQEGVRGELGYSSDIRKSALRQTLKRSREGHASALRDYACESFCDTGSYVLLGEERRAQHSEYTLSERALQRRCRVWSQIVLE